MALSDAGLPKQRVRLTKQEKERQTMHRVIYDLGVDSLTGDVVGIIEKLTDWLGLSKDGETLKIETEYCYEAEWLQLVAYRDETDEEYKVRIEKLKKEKRTAIKKQEAADRKLMKELLKKYGD